MTAAPDLLEHALRADHAGVCALPPKEDGSKRPETERVWDEAEGRWRESWARWQRERSTEKELRTFYANGRTGLGYVTGAVSGNLELFEFEEQHVFEAYCDRAREVGLGDLLERVRNGYEEESPNGGIHLFHRCAEIAGNTKLACREKRPDERKHGNDRIKVKIETRGEGGFAVVAPSHGRVHATGKAYRLLRGGPETIATITPEEREALHDLARTFDEMPRQEATGSAGKKRTSGDGELRPGDDFNARATWREVLEPNGWHHVFERGGEAYWRRPGRLDGISATTNYRGSGLLYVFSTSTDFDAERGYDKFGAYALLNHGGDLAAAARALASQGYGEHLRTRGAADDDEPERCTDLGNARRLVRQHGRDLHYCHPLESWFVWDGRRWKRDEDGEVERRAKQTVSTIYAEASEAASEDERSRLGKWALKSESRERIRALIGLAQSEPGIPILPQDFDADPFVLNVENGTIDLRNARLREHRRQDLITKMAPVTFDMGAHSERWTRFIEKALPDVHTRWYAQKMAGRALLGRTGDDKLFIPYGPTRTGKGTFESALEGTLGEYAVTAGLSDFAERGKQNAQGPRPEIVRLRGTRLVLVYETSRRLRLSSSLVKTLCGSDSITVRDLYSKPITFVPMFTLLIATNYRPWLPDDDDAVWERVVEIPFRVQIPESERDPSLRNELRDPKVSGPAVLNWMLEGCLAYQREGLTPSKDVQEATSDYKKSMDPLIDFEDELVFSESSTVTAKALRDAYVAWCEQNDRKPVSAKRLAAGLESRRCRKSKTRIDGEEARIWTGVRLADADPVRRETPRDASPQEF